MPWIETNPAKQRQHEYRDYSSGQWSMSELCDRYQSSRPTGYKWIDRIEVEGLKAVEDRYIGPHPRIGEARHMISHEPDVCGHE